LPFPCAHSRGGRVVAAIQPIDMTDSSPPAQFWNRAAYDV